MFSRRDKKVLFVGDSILRDLDEYLNHLDVNYVYDVLCFPGAKVKNLRHFLKEHFRDIIYEEETTHIVVHVGTNNLRSGLWEREAPDYITLITTLRELFRRAKIIFSAILPRWDSDELYDKSLYFNNQLEQLCAKLGCGYIDISNDVLELDNGFCHDGLHLSALGKAFFSYSIDLSLIHCFVKERERVVRKPQSWIPRELKILWTPKPEKPKKKEQKEIDCSISKRRERKKKWWPRRTPRKRTVTCITPDGFIYPRKVAYIKPPPQLPPNQYIGRKIDGWIPYTNLHHVGKSYKTEGSRTFPSQRKPYIQRKVRNRRKKSRKYCRKRRKVCWIFR